LRAFALLLLLPAPVLAQTGGEAERARLFFEAGNIAYRKGHYLEAVQSFQEAHRAYPQPEIAFSLAQALRRQFAASGEVTLAERAIQHYREYLEGAAEGRRRPEAVEQIELLSRSLKPTTPDPSGTAPLEAPPTELMLFSETDGARAAVDGAEMQPLTLVARVEPGQRTINAEADGYRPVQLKVLAIEGQKTAVRIDFSPKPGLLHIAAPDGAAGREVGEAPLDSALSLDPGRHRVVVGAPGYHPYLATVAMERAGQRSLLVALETTPQRTIAHSTAAAGGAGLLMAAIATGLALRWESQALELRSQLPDTNVPPETIIDLNHKIELRNTARTVAASGWISTALLAALSAVLYLTDFELPARERLFLTR
jgi:hypothetical protein